MTRTNGEELARLRERLEYSEDRAQVRSDARTRRIRRRAALAGQEARTRHEVAQSGEARAMRIERTRVWALAALLPVLVAFGAWSAAGVQAGMVALLSLGPDSTAAAMAWLVEPALLGIVAGVILIRARLQGAGGDLDERAIRIEWAALSTSIILNAAGHWPDTLGPAGLAALAGHALGPLGAAGTAYLISVIQDGIAAADPWHLDDGTRAPVLSAAAAPEGTPAAAFESTGSSALGSTVESASEAADSAAVESTPAGAAEERRPALEWVTVPADARRLPLVAKSAPKAIAAAPARQQRPAAEQDRERTSEAPRRVRSAPFKSASAAAGEPSPRALSDTDLADRLSAFVSTGELAPDAPVRQVQSALGLGFERAKRVLALHYERTETVVAESADEDAHQREEVAA